MTDHHNPKSMDDNYGITSIAESTSQQEKRGSPIPSHYTQESFYKFNLPQCDSSHVVPKTSSHLRLIVCGDSGIGKSSLVGALSSTTVPNTLALEPIEVNIPTTHHYIVDTPGYGALSRAEVIFSSTKNYLEQQFEKTNSLFNSQQQDERMLHIVNQAVDAFTHIHACLYLIMGRLKPVDLEYMRTVHDLVNIIPVIIQPDLSLRAEIILQQRLDILSTMESNGIKYSQFGYDNYQEMMNACKEPSKHPHCPPFMLDWSLTKQKRSFHGLLPLKQTLYQYQAHYLHATTSEKYISWRNGNITHGSSISSSSSSQEQSKHHTMNHSIRISQYVSKRRHSLEREFLDQEKKLRQKFELADKQRRTELVLKELCLLVNTTEQPLIVQHQKNQQLPMTHSRYWIVLSILLSLFICYQNRHFLL